MILIIIIIIIIKIIIIIISKVLRMNKRYISINPFLVAHFRKTLSMILFPFGSLSGQKQQKLKRGNC